MFNLEKVGDPLYEAVTLDEVKKHCGVYGNADNARLSTVVVDAREMVEKDLNVAVVGQTYKLYTENGFADIKFPIQPVASITSIEYTDSEGSTATLDADSYKLKTYKDPPELIYKGTLPAGTDVVITFVAGFPSHLGEDDIIVGEVPPNIKSAILLMAGLRNEFREAVITGTVATVVPLGYERIISRNRVSRYR